jgi:hypothetical protein
VAVMGGVRTLRPLVVDNAGVGHSGVCTDQLLLLGR